MLQKPAPWRRRHLVRMVIALLVATGLPIIASPAAHATQSTGWPVSATGMPYIERLVSGRDGSVTGAECGGTGGFRTWDASGALVNSPPASGPRIFACRKSLAVGPDGTLYTGVTTADAPELLKVAAFRNGSMLWLKSLPQSTPPGQCKYGEINRLIIGSDGHPYALSGNKGSRSGCNTDWWLSKLDTPGNDAPTKKVQLPGRFGYGMSHESQAIAPYQGGIAVLPVFDNRLRFYTNDLTPVTASGVQVTTVYGPQDEGDFSVHPSGRVWMPQFSTSLPSGCNLSSVTPVIDTYTANGKGQSYVVPSCSQVLTLRPTPEGGAVGLVRRTFGHYKRADILLIRPGDTQARIIEKPFLEGIGSEAAAMRGLRVDLNGNLLLHQAFVRNGYRGTEFELLKADAVTQALRFATTEIRSNVDFGVGPEAVALGTGRLYFAGNVDGLKVYSRVLTHLSMDYPRGDLLGGSLRPTLRYVAMGDSFASGEGVPSFDPDTNRMSGDRFNLCHRSYKAYSALLDQDIDLRVERTGFFACSGALTSHLIDTWQYAWSQQPQNVLLAAVGGADVITLSIGGNDSGFSNVAHQCISEGEEACRTARNQMRASIENELGAKLHAAYEHIQLAAGNNNVRVLVIGYPYIFPQSRPFEYACSWETPFLPGRNVTDEEFADLYALTNMLNDEIRRQVDFMGQGFVFVDPRPRFKGHELCTGNAYIHDVKIDYWGVFTYHPTEIGQALLAEIIKPYMMY